MSRADRVADGARRARARPAAGHRPRQPALPDRLHRLERRWPSWAATCAASSPTSATSSRPPRRCPDFDREQGPQDFLTALGGRLAGGRAAAGLRGRPRLGPPPRAAARGDPRPDRARARRRRRRALRAVKEPGEIERIAAAAALADEVYGVLREQGLVGPHGARGRARARERDAAARRPSRASRRSSPPPSAGRCRTRCRPTCRSRAGRWSRSTSARGSTATARTARARGRPASCPTTSPRPTRSSCAPRQAALDAVRPGPEGREVDAVARDIIEAAGHGEHFGHGLGHGVGLEVHEGPRLARTADGAAGGRERRDGRARRLPAGPRRRADRGPRRRSPRTATTCSRARTRSSDLVD